MSDIRDFCPLWGEWEAESKLGEGSYGAVWKMRREMPGGQAHYAAVKHISIPRDESEIQNLIDESVFTNRDSAARYYNRLLDSLVNEIDTMHKLQGYTNIVSYEDHKIIPKKKGIGYDLFLRMELLTPLTVRMRSRMTTADVIRLGCDIAEAIVVLNKFNLIHRDIKPQNIFINNTGDYKLGDYGTARALNSDATALSRKGTFNYMAPEIYNNQPADSRVDIYSLGLVLYRLLNGNRLPFLPLNGDITNSMNEEAVVRRLSGEPIPAPANAGGNLAGIVLKACAFRPEDRYQSAADLKKDLLRCLDGDSRPLRGRETELNPSDSLSFRFSKTDGGAGSTKGAATGDKGKQPGASRPSAPQQAGKKKTNVLRLVIPLVVFVLAVGVILLLNGQMKHNGENDSGKPEEAVNARAVTETMDIIVTPTPSPRQEEKEKTPTNPPASAGTEMPAEVPAKADTEAITAANSISQGDMNGDGVTDAKDGELLRQFVSGWDVMLDEGKADLNRDGTVDLADLIRLMKMLER
jgi:serine/threonine-protein kinase